MVEAVGEVLVVEERVQDVHGQEHRSYIQHLQENADFFCKSLLCNITRYSCVNCR